MRNVACLLRRWRQQSPCPPLARCTVRYGVLRHSADAPHPTHAPYRQATLDAAFAGPACFNLRYVLGDEGLAIPRRGARPRRHAPNQPPPHPVPPESSYDDLRLPVASGANYVAGLRPVALGGATYFGFAASTLDVPGNATFVYTSGTPVGLVADAGLFDATSVTLVQTATPNVLLVRGKVSGRGDYVQCANRTLAGAEGVVITVPLVGCTGLSSLVITQPPTFQPAPSVRVLGLALCPAAGSSLAPLAPGTLLPDPESAFTLPDAHPAHGRRLEGLDDLVAEVRAAKAKAEAALDDVKAKEEAVKAEIKAKHAAALEGLKNKTEEAVGGAKRKAGGAGRDAARALDDVSLEAKAKLGSVKVLEARVGSGAGGRVQ